jgi:hypothetical protein
MDDTLKNELREAGYQGNFELSELIEACGGELSFMKSKDKTVVFDNHNPLESTKREEGPTPEEAVARLWLALNRKE